MYRINSYGKINLALDVLSKREDGYHNIDTIMQLVDLKDVVTIELRKDDDLNIECNVSAVPVGEDNLIYKAWEKLKPYKKDGNCGLNVNIEKNIPVAAGLAGGSSNAGYFMKLLNQTWGLGLSTEKLMEIGSKIGADIPYFFKGGTVRATGIGDEFTNLKPLTNLNVLIVNSGCEVSTKYVYDNIKLTEKSEINKLVDGINAGDIYNKNLYYNTMTEVSLKICPEIKIIIKELENLGGDIVLMSGSGATVFGIFKNSEVFEKAYLQLKDKYNFVFKTKTI